MTPSQNSNHPLDIYQNSAKIQLQTFCLCAAQPLSGEHRQKVFLLPPDRYFSSSIRTHSNAFVLPTPNLPRNSAVYQYTVRRSTINRSAISRRGCPSRNIWHTSHSRGVNVMPLNWFRCIASSFPLTLELKKTVKQIVFPFQGCDRGSSPVGDTKDALQISLQGVFFSTKQSASPQLFCDEW